MHRLKSNNFYTFSTRQLRHGQLYLFYWYVKAINTVHVAFGCRMILFRSLFLALLGHENIRKYHYYSVGRKIPWVVHTNVVNVTDGRLLYLWILVYVLPIIYFKYTLRIGDSFAMDCPNFYDCRRYVVHIHEVLLFSKSRKKWFELTSVLFLKGCFSY